MTRAVGPDVSKYQMSFDPDHSVKQIDFVIQRLSYGMIEDQLRSRIWQGVEKISLRAAYHYYSTAVPWKEQADFFLSLAEGKGYRAFFVDYEHMYNHLTTQTARDYKKMLDYIQGKYPQRKVLGYSGVYVYRDDLMPSKVNFSNYDWWFARYPWLCNPQTSIPNLLILPEERDWTFWQYTKTGPGHLYGCEWQYVDLNVYNGTKEELKKEWAGIVPPTPPVIDIREETITECIDALKEL